MTIMEGRVCLVTGSTSGIGKEIAAGLAGMGATVVLAGRSREKCEAAVQEIAADVSAGKLEASDIDDKTISSYLYTADQPDPDMLIRPGGEHRLSNFLLYQVAYTELVMSDVYWPDFGRDEFVRTLQEFQKRQRRFGGK